MIATHRGRRILGVLIALTSVFALTAARQAVAQSNQRSDELLVTGPGGLPVLYDTLLPEGGPAAGPGSEGSLVFSPGLPAIVPPGGLGALIGAPGVSYVILTEEPGFVPDPSELPPPVWIGPNNQDFFVSDVLMNGLANQGGLPPFIALVSDDNPDLARVVALLPPSTPHLAETGLFQDLTGMMGPVILPGFGPVQVQVRSDIAIPEPSTVVLAGSGLAILAALRWRRRKSSR